MKIKRIGFLRRFGGVTMLCDPRTNGSMVFADETGMIHDLAEGLDTSDVLKRMIGLCEGLNAKEVLSDMRMLMQEIEENGLGKLLDTQREQCCRSVKKEVPRTKIHVDQNMVVSRFYNKYQLLSELHLDLTDACTEQCVHCYVPQGQHDYLPYEVCEKALQEFREQQGLAVQLTGGECMLHPDFAKICRLCRELDLNFIVMSNLTLCDADVVALLKESDPQFVNVSLYSMDEHEHDAVTQVPGSWRKTRAAIDALQEAGVAVRLATPLLKANQSAYPPLKQFAKERRVHLIPDCDIIPRCGGDCSNLNYACTPEEVERVLAGDKEFWDCGYGKNPNMKPEDKVCDIGQLLGLNSKGLYYPCAGMHDYILGDAREVTLTDIWQGEKMKYLRELKNKDFPQCVGCEHRAFCKVCPAFNFNATGSLFKTISAKCAVSAVKHKVFGGE